MYTLQNARLAMCLALLSTAFFPGCGCDSNGESNGHVSMADISITDVIIYEGDSGSTDILFTVTASSEPLSGYTISVDWTTADGTATAANSDFTAASGMVTFVNGGPLTQQITVNVNGDEVWENDEDFCINLSNPVNAGISDAQGVGTILNDDGVRRLVDPTSDGGVEDGLVWSTAYHDVQPAVDDVQAEGEGEVWVSAGVYTNNNSGTATVLTLKSSVKVYGGFSGYKGGAGLQESSRLDRDFRIHESRLDGTDTAWHVVVGADAAVLDGFTVTRGNAIGLPENKGGGLCCESVSPRIANCIFHGNQSRFAGGAAYFFGSESCIENCLFLRNCASSKGGGIASNTGGQLTIVNCRFFENKSILEGGAIALSDSTGNIRNCVFAGNFNYDQSGGAISNHLNSSPEITNCVFVSNDAVIYGGAIANNLGSNPIITNSIFLNNTAIYGNGEIYNNNSVPQVKNCIVDGSGGSGSWDTSYGDDMGGNIDQDPSFSGTDDFHLNPDSPGIDAGDGDAAPEYDIEGSPRYDSTVTDTGTGAVTFTDIGTYEYSGDYLGLTSPNGTGTYLEAESCSIEWTSIGISGQVELHYTIDGGVSWNLIDTVQFDSGPYAWAIPNGVNSTQCMVRVREATGPLADTSDSVFEIRVPVVLYVDGSVAASGNGLSWAEAFKTIQESLLASEYGDEIWVAQGTYTNNGGGTATVLHLVSNVALYGGFDGTEVSRSERDWTAHSTILDGENTAYHVVRGHNNAVLDGFIVTGGNAAGTDEDSKGGGMLITSTTPLIRNCVFDSNTANTGAGLYSLKNGSPVFVDCVFTDNIANSAGGAVSSNDDCPLFIRCRFSGNSATRGGAIYAWGSFVAVECLFTANASTGNTPGEGGGAVYFGGAGTEAVFTNCTLYGNSAVNTGGAIHSEDNWYANIENTIIYGNTAGVSGDQIYINDGVIFHYYSNVEGSGGSSSWDTSFGIDIVGNIDVAPQFTDPDGPDDILGNADDDFSLLSTSLCSDAGDNALVPLDDYDLDGDGDVLELLPLDFEGNERFKDNPAVSDSGNGTAPIVDIGAYEYQ